MQRARRPGLLAVLRESIASAVTQPVASLVTIAMVAGMCTIVLLTTGRTVGAEQAVIGSIDSAGTRSIIVRAESDSGLDTSVLDRLKDVEGIEWIGAFGIAMDTTNAEVPGGTKVPARTAWLSDSAVLGIPAMSALPEQSAWGSEEAMTQLGIADSAGSVEAADGTSYSMVGVATVPHYLQFLEPLIVAPQTFDRGHPGTVSVLVVVAQRPDLVSPLSTTIQGVLDVADPTKVKVATSESLATLRALIQGQLGTFGRSLVIVVFGLTAVLVAAILYGLVLLRRKDFGRRRALGASRSLIVGLLLAQVAILSAVGATLGILAGSIALLVTNDPLPDWQFTVAISYLAVLVGTTAALVPALAASRREPIKELRVP